MSERIELIKQLRERTGAGLRDCKKALLANGNDVDKSVDWLREKGIAKQAKKAATRIATEGVAWLRTEGNKAARIEINSETDFVANSDPFRALVKTVNAIVLKNRPKTVEEAKLLKDENGKTIADLFIDAGVKLGEKLDFRRLVTVEKSDDEVFGPYIHRNGKIATLIVLKGGSAENATGLVSMSAPITRLTSTRVIFRKKSSTRKGRSSPKLLSRIRNSLASRKQSRTRLSVAVSRRLSSSLI